VVVLADNCTDATASLASAAGALVWVRDDPDRRGKGFALAHAYAASLHDGFADGVVVVDADTSVSANLLGAFAARFAAGAECAQADYGVRNAGESWRTRLMAIAFAMHHTLRSLARERLSLSCGLRGNGMAFSSALLRRIPFQAFSPVEDVEYGLLLGAAGVRVAYVAEATVVGDMPASAVAARAQRDRWEVGRRMLLRRHLPALVRAAVNRRDLMPLELAVDLLIPPLVLFTSIVASGAIASGTLVWTLRTGMIGAAEWGIAAAGVVVYACRGWAISGAGARGTLDLLWLPVYISWKLLGVRPPSRAARGEWVRTPRTSED
jgi:cellulose synthase/poly-beta-1,6-N-acetylglucosamine synthase-like glycosyltransferase